MKKIYFVRHGATENNHSNRFQDENTKLSALGLKQAEFLGQRFNSVKVDKIISSDTTRALQTATAIADVKKQTVIKSNLFKEILRPSIVRNKSKDDVDVKSVMQMISCNFGNSEYRHSDEENFYDLMDRSEKAMTYIAEQDDEDILVVTHGKYLTFLIGYMLFGKNFSPDEFRKMENFFVAKNTGITIVESTGDKFSLLVWNDHAHLGELDIK